MTFMRPMDFEFGPDGALYLIEWGSGFGGNNDDSGVYRIDYIAGDRAPIAAATGDPTTGAAPLTVQFSSAGSRDPDGQRAHLRVGLRRRRHLDRGRTRRTPTPTAGNYTAQLTVTDTDGRTAVANVPITVGNTAPTVTIDVPAGRRLLRLGRPGRVHGHRHRPRGRHDRLRQGDVQYCLGHDEHAHPLQQYTGCTGTVQTSLAIRARRRRQRLRASSRPPTPTTAAPAAPARSPAGRIEQSCSPSASRPSTSPPPGGRPAAPAAATRACSARPPATPPGGFQNIGSSRTATGGRSTRRT